MNNRQRNRQIKFYVNDKEFEQIEERYRLANTTDRGAYLRKIAIDGYIINIDTSDLKAAVKEMNGIGKNINQIVRNANICGVTKQDIDAIKERVDEIWLLLKSTLLKLRSVNQ